MMQRATVCGLLLMAFVGTAAADETKTAGTEAALQEKISIDLEEAPAADFLRSLEKLTGCRIVIPNPRRLAPITLRVRNVRVRTVLDAVCDSLGYTWSVDGNARPAAIYLDPHGNAEPGAAQRPRPVTERIQIEVEDAQVRDLLHSLARLLGVREEIAEGVAGKMSLEVHSVPASEVLDDICRKAHCTWSLEHPEAQEPVLRVQPAP